MKGSRAARRQRDSEFEEFVVGSTPSLRRTAYLMCGDWHKAEDIVQSALIRVYSKWAKIEHDNGPGPYARKAVVNAAIDDARKPWRRERSVSVTPDVVTVPGHEHAVHAQEEIANALAALPPRQRAVVVLRYAHDHDVETTAQMLGISRGAVKSQASRGLAAMREFLRTADVSSEEAAR